MTHYHHYCHYRQLPKLRGGLDPERATASRRSEGTQLKAPCLYPLEDGRRCLECETCQPCPEGTP